MGSHKPVGAGLCVHDKRIRHSSLRANTSTASTSAYTEAGPRPASAVSDEARSLLTPEVSNAQSQDFTIDIGRSGNAELSDTAGVRYTFSDSSGVEYGWSSPAELVSFEPVAWVTSGTGTITQQAATHPVTGEPWVIYTTGTVCKIDRWDTATEAWTSVDADVASSAGLSQTPCALAFAPDGSCFAIVQTTSAAWYVAGYDPSENKSTLTTSANGLGFVPEWASMVFVGGSTLLLFTADSTTIRQHVSDDLGASWTEVGSEASYGTVPSAFRLPAHGGFGVVYADSSTDARFFRIASEWDDFGSATAVEIDAALTSVSHCCGWADPGGTVYSLQEDSSLGSVVLHMSYDGGETWTVADWSAFWNNDALTHPKNLTATAVAGGAVLLCNHDTADTSDESLSALWLGGWNNAYNPPNGGLSEYFGYGDYQTSGPGPTASGSGGRTWLPYDQPDASADWTLVGTAGTMQSGYMRILTSAANGRYRISTSTNMLVDAVFSMNRQSGGSTGTDQIAIRITVANGSLDYEVRLRFVGTNTVEVYDPNASGGAGSTLTTFTHNTNWNQYRVVLNSGACKVYSRIDGHIQNWTQRLSQALTLAGTPGATGLIEFGHNASTAETWWRGAYVRSGVAQATSAPDGPMYALPSPIPHIGSDTQVAYLRGLGGPALTGTTYTMDAEHDYPVEHAIDPMQHPSPSSEWRATGTALTRFVFEFKYSDGTTPTSAQNGDSFFLALLGANFKTAEVRFWNGSSFPDGNHDVNLATGFEGLDFVSNDGDSITVRQIGGTDGARHIGENELAGGHVIFSGGNCQRIRGNTAGSWNAASGDDTARPVIYLDGDASSTGGTCDIVWPSGVAVFHLTSETYTGTSYELQSGRVEIRIPASQTIPDSEYRLGGVLFGRVRPMGADPDWGWVQSDRHLTEVTEARHRRKVRKLGPPASTWTWDFVGGQNWRGQRSGADQDYRAITSTTGERVAKDDLFRLLRGILRTDLDSGEVPVVALMEIPADGTTITDPTLFLAGHVESTEIRWESVGGDPDVDEQGRVPSIRIRELV